jgi:uncharacterized membrane-anchored protein YhcB (DUF1043 family)
MISLIKSVVVGSAFIALGAIGVHTNMQQMEKNEKLQNKLNENEKRFNEFEEIKQYALKTMEVVKVKKDNFKKQLYAEKISNAAVKYLKNKERREAFVILLSIESKFEPKAKSPVNAIGIGQIMPQWATEHASTCGLEVKDISSDDLYDIDINLAVSACHFNYLIDEIEKEQGDIKQALSAYNAGKHSITTKKVGMVKFINPDVCAAIKINDETCGYIINFQKVKKLAQL